MTKISIIIPCHNQEKYITDCLNSVLNQTFDDYEAIVIDDGSDDNSMHIVKKFQQKSSKIRLIQQSNQGVVSARNNAIKQAMGKYIYPLDADDIIHPRALEKLYNAIESRAGDIITCNVILFSQNDRRIMSLPSPKKINMVKQNCLVNCALFRKSDFDQCGGYDRTFDKGWEDYDLWLNLMFNHNLKVYKVPECLFFYRQKNCEESRNAKTTKNQDALFNSLYKKYPQMRKGSFLYILNSILNFIYKKKITKSNKVTIKICKIPIFYRKNAPIKLHFFNTIKNFGDVLNIDLFEKFTFKTIDHCDIKKCKIVAIGSLLGSVLSKKNKLKNKNPVIVYGSGFIEAPNKDDFFARPLDVRAVRGYLTLERLKKCKNVTIAPNMAVGDPALLIPKLFDVSSIKKKYQLAIIPHYVDKNSDLLRKIKVKNAIVIDVAENTEDFIKKVAECEAVISSAMHGLICADSLCIPNIRMILSDKIIGGDYKFDDYYSAFGIKNHNKIDLNKQNFDERDLHKLFQTYSIDKENLAKIQNDLIKAFPY